MISILSKQGWPNSTCIAINCNVVQCFIAINLLYVVSFIVRHSTVLQYIALFVLAHTELIKCVNFRVGLFYKVYTITLQASFYYSIMQGQDLKSIVKHYFTNCTTDDTKWKCQSGKLLTQKRMLDGRTYSVT